MNRRGFLSMLGAALAEPLIPKGTAFSFLGGIYRPAWVEVPTAWPITSLKLYDKNTLEVMEGFSLEDARRIQTFQASVAALGGGEVPRGIAASFDEISPPTRAKLFQDRHGNWRILQVPFRSQGLNDLRVSGGLTIEAEGTLCWPKEITFIGPSGPPGKTVTAYCD